MTSDDLTALCKRLATELMGWGEIIEPDYPYYARWRTGKDSVQYVKDWDPTSNIAQAFLVAEKIASERWAFRLERFLDTKSNPWSASFGGFYSRAEAPEMAICLAADAWLKGKGDAK